MSLAAALKDFADIANEIYNAKGVNGELPNAVVAQHAFIYGLKSLGVGFFYLVSFQWLRDFSYLPLLAAELNSSAPPLAIAAGDASDLVNSSLPNPGSLVEGPYSYLFTLFQSSHTVNDQFVAGFLNSFFFCLPLSLPHLISIRRLFYQGTIAAAASLTGTLMAHSLFLIGVMYGIRFLIIPWFSLEPLNYIIGIAAISISLNGIVREKYMKLVPLTDRFTLAKFFVLNFVLAWCEETTLFHSIGNLTVNAAPTYLDIYPGRDWLDSFLIHTSYVLAFIFGSIFFSILFYYLILRGNRLLRSWTGMTYSKMARIVNKLMTLLIVAFGLSSLPYYGLDYLFGNTLGFLPEDQIYQKTLFSPTQILSKSPSRTFKETSSAPNERTPLSLDLNYFDRGLYLNAPFHPKKITTKSTIPHLGFEELNYQGEYAWVMREEASKRLIETRKTAVSSLFKKARRYYVNLRASYDAKREEADKKAKQHVGKIAKQEEGTIPGEKGNNLLKLPDFLGQGFLLPKNVEQGMRHFQTPGSRSEEDEENSFLDSDLNSYNETKPRKMIKAVPKYKNIDPLQQDVNFDHEFISTYSKGFAPPVTMTYQQSAKNWIPMKRVIKRKFYMNPIYRSLLNLDIDSFLGRQKKAYKLAANQEHSLYQKRQMLAKYYNWLRYYQPFQKTVQLLYEIPESRSFVDRIYHQQFKGTLKVARRLFSVTFDPEENAENYRVLSYDQPLYKDSHASTNPFIHEELAYDNDDNELQHINVDLTKLSSEDTDQSETEQENQDDVELINKQIDVKNSPFFEETFSSPTYAGWDENLRKFVVTNRFVSNTHD